MQRLSIHDEQETPEVRQFRQLPQCHQQRLLLHYPRVLADTAMRYSSGDDCEQIVQQQLRATPETLSCSNSDGDNVVANSLLQRQAPRAAFLVDLSIRNNRRALEQRSQYKENLLMLSTMLGDSVKEVMEMLMTSDPTQLHRHYDAAGRNLLHHCVVEESIEPLRAAVQLTSSFLSTGMLRSEEVRAALHMSDNDGNTPMHLAAASNRTDMLELISELSDRHRLDVNFDETQHRGHRRTPLMEAVANNATASCEFLLRNGLVDPDAQDRYGRRATELTDSSDLRQQLELWYRQFFQQQQVQVPQPKNVEVTSLQSCSADSGVGSMETGEADDEMDGSAAASCAPLSRCEMEAVEQRLQESGKVEEFLQAFKPSSSSMNCEQFCSIMSSPVFLVLSAHSQHQQLRRQVQKALADVGVHCSL